MGDSYDFQMSFLCKYSIRKNILLRLSEIHNALQLPVVFFFFLLFFFSQPCPGLQNCKLVFLILKTSQYADRCSESSFF